MEDERIIVRSAIPPDVVFANQSIQEMENSALLRGSGISKRSAASTIEKINGGEAVVGPIEIAQELRFWEGCKSCVNYDVLESKNRCNCLCTAMLFDLNPN